MSNTDNEPAFGTSDWRPPGWEMMRAELRTGDLLLAEPTKGPLLVTVRVIDDYFEHRPFRALFGKAAHWDHEMSLEALAAASRRMTRMAKPPEGFQIVALIQTPRPMDEFSEILSRVVQRYPKARLMGSTVNGWTTIIDTPPVRCVLAARYQDFAEYCRQAGIDERKQARFIIAPEQACGLPFGTDLTALPGYREAARWPDIVDQFEKRGGRIIHAEGGARGTGGDEGRGEAPEIFPATAGPAAQPTKTADR